MTETVYDLGLQATLVGVTGSCNHPSINENAIVRIGEKDALNIATIVELRPDLIIANPEENAPSDLEQLIATGMAIWMTFPRTVAEAINLIWETLYIFMVDDRMLYEKVNAIHRTYDWILSLSEAREHVVCKVFTPILADPLATLSADTYTHDLLRITGGTNIFADKRGEKTSEDPAQDLGRYPIVSLEEVETRQPDIILLSNDQFDTASVSRFARLDVPAAANDAIYRVDSALLMYYGTRLAWSLNELSYLIDQGCSSEGV